MSQLSLMQTKTSTNMRQLLTRRHITSKVKLRLLFLINKKGNK